MPALTKKKCKRCSVVKPVTDFGLRSGICITCKGARHRRAVSTDHLQYLTGLYAQCKYSHTKRKDSPGHFRAEFNLEKEDLFNLWEEQAGRCALSGVVLTHHKDGSGRKDFNASIDRIVPHEPYIKENVQLVAFRVNLMKHELTEDLFYWWIRTLLENMKVDNNA